MENESHAIWCAMTRIALLEDNERLAELVRRGLGAAGIESDHFTHLETAWSAAQQVDYGLFLIDRGLPDGDGLTLVNRLRAAGIRHPCLMLTARDALHDRVQGLDGGADDYLSKPFSMEELVARVRALLRRPATLQSLTPQFGGVEIRPQAGSMACGTEVVTLAPAELQIMLSLVKANGDTVRRTALEAAAWGLGDAVTPNALDVALHRLKRKLQAIGSVLQIVNSRGYGYALSETR
jgi:DNA-binding response OmpR family regulator